MCASRSPNTLSHTSSPRLVLIHLVQRLSRPAFVTCYGIILNRKSPANPEAPFFIRLIICICNAVCNSIASNHSGEESYRSPASRTPSELHDRGPGQES